MVVLGEEILPGRIDSQVAWCIATLEGRLALLRGQPVPIEDLA